MTLAAGTRLGPYQIGEQLGAGGMGEVYRARDTRLDRRVAIKVLPKHLAGRPELRERFEREARTISSLNHPHICTLYDIGSHDGVEFLVMEYLDGETLAQRLTRGALPLPEALGIAIQIADAIASAHREGVVHRDLKPGNVMLTKSGAKVLDFGLAKQGAPPGGSSLGVSALPTQGAPLTVEGTILGTLQYMSPEQLEGQEADARTDIFAFGAVLYEIVTGRRAFDGKSHVSLIAAIVDHEPPPVSSTQPVSPRLLDYLVQTCLAKNPDKRWQTMADVLLQLKLIAESGPDAPATEAAPRIAKRLRVAWSAAAVLLVACVALTAYALWPRTPALQPKISFEIATPSAPSPNQFALSPTGSHLVAIVISERGPMLWLRPLQHLNAQPLAGSEDARFPFWSPDGRFIGFFAQGKLKKIDIQGGPPQTLADAPDGHGGTWNRGDVIVFAPTGNSPLFRVSAAGGAAENLTELDKPHEELAQRHPQFLPDGEHFIYVSVRAKGMSCAYVGSLDSHERRFIASTSHKTLFAPPGHILFVRENILMAQVFDLTRLVAEGNPFPVAEDVGNYLPNSAAGFAVSETGTVAYRTGGSANNSRLLWYDRTGKTRDAVKEINPYLSADLSPDGGRIATSIAEGSNKASLWLLDLARGTNTKFTFGMGFDDDPIWSPDGRRIVFGRAARSSSDLYTKNAGGIGDDELLYASDHQKDPTDWSADGRFVLYGDLDPQTTLDVWALPMTGEKKPIQVARSKFGEWGARFAPDGQWLVYASAESGRAEVYAQPFPTATSRVQISTNGGDHPLWNAKGNEILFLANNETDVMAVPVSVTGDGILKAGLPAKLFSLPFNAFNSWALTRDGQQLLVNAGTQQTSTVRPITLVLNWRGAP